MCVRRGVHTYVCTRVWELLVSLTAATAALVYSVLYASTPSIRTQDNCVERSEGDESEGHISRNRCRFLCGPALAARASSCTPHSSFYPFPSFCFPPSGALDKIVLPYGMQSVDFSYCSNLTGTAES